MRTDPLLRFLDIARREMGAADAHLELGGREPESERVITTSLDGGFRLVLQFSEPPSNRSDLLTKLETLVSSFSSTLDTELGTRQEATSVPAVRALAEELAVLAERIGHASAIVVDVRSPEIWGASHTSLVAEDDVKSLELAAEWAQHVEDTGADMAARLTRPATMPPPGSEGEEGSSRGPSSEEITRLRTRYPEREESTWRRYLALATGVARGRARFGEGHAGHQFRGREMYRGEHSGWIVRPFATIYLLVVAVEGTLSELSADGAMLHALPAIERLTLSLPPRDPPPRGGRVFKLVPR